MKEATVNHLVILLRTIAEAHEQGLTQRSIGKKTGMSLGKTNSIIKAAINNGLISAEHNSYCLTNKGWVLLEKHRVDNAVILAAGFGSRLVPFTLDTPKGLLQINNQPLIERQIEQLHSAGITDITIVVGYLKEKFDYLIDTYGVKLLFNSEFSTKNSIASVYTALSEFKNTYLLASDNWIEENIFHTWEPNSWMCCIHSDGPTHEWGVTVGAYNRITKIETSGTNCWALVGPAYFAKKDSAVFKELVSDHYLKLGTSNDYWEQVIKENLSQFPIFINQQSADNIHEFDSFEELRTYNNSFWKATDNAIMNEIALVLKTSENDVVEIEPLKEGLSNASFIFRIKSQGPQRYVFRKPGIGTDKLINRHNEKKIYEILKDYSIADEVVWFDENSGNRITKFWENVRTADPFDDNDLKLSMRLVRSIHDKEFYVENSFDMPRMIQYYRELCEEKGAIRFQDFNSVLQCVFTLLDFRERLAITEVLCHGDFLCANVLIFSDNSNRLIDWEFGGAADPIMDVAMFGIYSYFDRARLDLSLKFYLERNPSKEEYARLYLYTALGGFLWSMWAEYKQSLGQEFGDYPLIMYRYMKDYFHILKEEGFMVVDEVVA